MKDKSTKRSKQSTTHKRPELKAVSHYGEKQGQFCSTTGVLPWMDGWMDGLSDS